MSGHFTRLMDVMTDKREYFVHVPRQKGQYP